MEQFIRGLVECRSEGEVLEVGDREVEQFIRELV